MNEKVREFLEMCKEEEIRRKSETDKVTNEEKNKLLIDLGLYEEVPSPNGMYSKEYPNFIGCDENGTPMYCKYVPVDVTDEEFEKIKKCASTLSSNITEDETESYKNGVATTLTVIAWVTYIVGFIAGLLLCDEVVALGIAEIAATFISGTTFLGFAEIIKLLQAIKNK